MRTNTYLYGELLYARFFDFLASPVVGENQKCGKHQCLGIGALNPRLYLLASFIGRRMYKGYEELKVCTFLRMFKWKVSTSFPCDEMNIEVGSLKARVIAFSYSVQAEEKTTKLCICS